MCTYYSHIFSFLSDPFLQEILAILLISHFSLHVYLDQCCSDHVRNLKWSYWLNNRILFCIHICSLLYSFNSTNERICVDWICCFKTYYEFFIAFLVARYSYFWYLGRFVLIKVPSLYASLTVVTLYVLKMNK